MKVISSKEYAANVEDVICEELTKAVGRAWGRIAMTYDFAHMFPVDSVMDDYEQGMVADARDAVITLFEGWGLKVVPDGRNF